MLPVTVSTIKRLLELISLSFCRLLEPEMVMSKFWHCVPTLKDNNYSSSRNGSEVWGRNFPAIEFAGKKSPDFAFSNVGGYA